MASSLAYQDLHGQYDGMYFTLQDISSDHTVFLGIVGIVLVATFT